MTAAGGAVVTGGASGIGLATCARLRDEGFTVTALDLRPDGAAAAADLTMRCDVTDEADVANAMAAVTEKLGGIDVLVNNAGITGSREAARCHETPVAEWDRVHAVNVRGDAGNQVADSVPVVIGEGELLHVGENRGP